MPGAKLKFPNPKICKPQNPAVLCPADRVIGLYNQDSGSTAKRIAKRFVSGSLPRQSRKAGQACTFFLISRPHMAQVVSFGFRLKKSTSRLTSLNKLWFYWHN